MPPPSGNSDTPSAPRRFAQLGSVGNVCRLGLATRGNTALDSASVLQAVERGINYLNWCGHPDGMRDAIRALGPHRREVHVAVQLAARTADAARRELDGYLEELGTDYVDVATYYYVEYADEWSRIVGRGGAADYLERARDEGIVRAIGLTSHQRSLAADIAASGRLDLLMIRYNAAHRGAETDVFPTTTRLQMPVVAFTCVRWGALMNSTPDDPPGFVPPPALQWYRFVLCQPAVAVALMAPDGERELHENLTLLDEWQGLTRHEYDQMRLHGERVRRHAVSFP